MKIYENPEFRVPLLSKSGDEILYVSYDPYTGTWIEPSYDFQRASLVGSIGDLVCRVPPYAKVDDLPNRMIRAAVAFPMYKRYEGSGTRCYVIDPAPLFSVVLKKMRVPKEAPFGTDVEGDR